jgi:hypothetical protein
MERNRAEFGYSYLAATLATCLVALLLLYVGAYLALVRVSPVTVTTGSGPWDCVPVYRIGGRTAQVFFTPANVIDRRIRHREWIVSDEDMVLIQ